MPVELLESGLKIVKGSRVIVPSEIGRLMLTIHGLLPSAGLEFGLYLKGVWVPEQAAVVVSAETYYFPKQRTTPGSIQFLEDPPSPDFNVVIHRHPQGVRDFSGVDQASINQEFLASILFIPMWDFPSAVVNIPLARGVKLQVRAAVEIGGSPFEASAELRAVVLERLSEPPTILIQAAGRPSTGLATRLPPAQAPARADLSGFNMARTRGRGLRGFTEDDLIEEIDGELGWSRP